VSVVSTPFSPRYTELAISPFLNSDSPDATRIEEPRHLPRAGHHSGSALHGYEFAGGRVPSAPCAMRFPNSDAFGGPIHGIVPREETVKGYEIAKDEYVRFEPEELKALEQASSSALVIDSFVPEAVSSPLASTPVAEAHSEEV
jgi:Ku70/Ku80 beta-barrel domain